MLLPAEARVTHLAPEWLHVTVGHDVQLELVEPMELLGAAQSVFERTFELFLNIMRERVSLELVIPVKLGPALFTFKGQFSSVYQHVGLQIVFILHFLLADLALKSPLGMGDGDVLPELSLSTELLVAVATGEGVGRGVQVMIKRLLARVPVLAF